MQKTNYKPMLVILYLAAFIAAFNENIINVAMVDIMAEFSISYSAAQWLVTGYMIVTSIIVTVMSFLSRRFTLRRLFYVAGACFLVGEAASFVMPNFPLLLAARLLQAVGSGVFIPLMMGTVLAVAPREKMGTYLSIGSAAITLGPAFAPVVSGVAATFIGWRAIHVVPFTVVALLAVAGAKLLRNIGEPESVKLDAPSLALASVGLTVFVFGLGEITTHLPLALVCIAVSVLVIAAFVRRQFVIPNPMLTMRPMTDPRFSVACILVIVAMMTTFSMSVLLPLYFEGTFGHTALLAGLLILPAIVVNAITAVIGGRIMDKSGPWPLIPVGFLLAAAGQCAIAAFSASMSLVVVVVASVAVYAGVGLMMSPSQTAGLRTLPREEHGAGVSIINTFNMVAASIGPSLFIGILSSGAAKASAEGTSANVGNAAGFSQAVLVAAGIAVLGLVVAVVYSYKERGAAPAAVHASETEIASGATVPSLADVMKRDAYTVPASATVADVARILVANKTSGVPVVGKAGAVLGFISDGDIMRALSKSETQAVDLGYYLAAMAEDEAFGDRVHDLLGRNVMDYATENVVCASADEPIDSVCAKLNGRRIKKMPVVENGRLVGTVSRSDIVRYLMESFVA
ncbi:Antiseptic resistance protein [Slackia heliotrinireducens]|uniref:Drug resistance transporter, EmrB/QacA subfamily n=1 Tax=Slackia heliotrinireducens (strain ATCC 29202 / DSM 20476 / NCTC 11029 / RHS 1) TaxID=471855 RepID=C7N3K4_SLAHD|nr:MFS transporter [Slackia heliotrinireducens]ACV23727.1 drug resistance transporter, EmrB/QacA subfamily [Slackia heliotrinireducens DSM 20476]VEH03321.1 Antiseptic resistance protein [Slackia heliotrinireducens]